MHLHTRDRDGEFEALDVGSVSTPALVDVHGFPNYPYEYLPEDSRPTSYGELNEFERFRNLVLQKKKCMLIK